MASANDGSRERILDNVRRALGRTAPRREGTTPGPIFAPVTDPLGRFQAECAATHTECVVTADAAATAAALENVLASLPAGEIFLQDAPGLRRLLPSAAEGRKLRWSSEGAPRETSQATVSLCEALVAMSGSIVVSSRNCGGRGISVVAPCHIVVAGIDQMVPDLEAAMERVRQVAPDSSYVGLITGTSRTSDIEKKLVIGAHGPQRVVVILQQ
jgi:L-lactate dehydrogenase complex protein LldG